MPRCPKGLFVDRRLRRYFACGLRGGALSAASVATRNNKFKLPTASAGSSGMNKKLSTTALGLILALSVSAAVEAKRSEEHTSGTPVTNAHIVCRLRLEKK